MNRQTAELIRLIEAVNQQLPRISTELLLGTSATKQQYEVGALVIELGELLHHHADDQKSGVIPAASGERTNVPLFQGRLPDHEPNGGHAELS
ncbi:hypothetical protein AB5J62_40810 [Amycolatopsis sp. cg5]|uniref:hypothetical protein n=1 Tax=Amycolatopsis sp. cg5 TaxID=3238802 RepID=UPI0035263D01